MVYCRFILFYPSNVRYFVFLYLNNVTNNMVVREITLYNKRWYTLLLPSRHETLTNSNEYYQNITII